MSDVTIYRLQLLLEDKLLDNQWSLSELYQLLNRKM